MYWVGGKETHADADDASLPSTLHSYLNISAPISMLQVADEAEYLFTMYGCVVEHVENE